MIAYDRAFKILIAPYAEEGTRKVLRRGIKVNGEYFWCEAFRESGVLGSRVEVKCDPDNAGIVYAFVREWQDCVSKHYPDLKGLSYREMQRKAQELRDNAADSRERKKASIPLMLSFLRRVKAKEALLLKAQEFDTNDHRNYEAAIIVAQERMKEAAALTTLNDEDLNDIWEECEDDIGDNEEDSN